MTIANNFEFANACELRRRYLSALIVGQRNLTGAEYAQWAPSLEHKIREIDQAIEGFFARLAFTGVQTTSAQMYVSYQSSAYSLTPLQPSLISSSITSTNLLTGVSPETIAPRLF